MTLRSRVCRSLERWRQSRAWQQKRREFVYLDEVSVTSLVAARDGAITESFKESLSATTAAEGGTTIEMAAPAGGPKAGWSSRTTASRTSATEVVRRAVIQGTFRSLRIGDTELRLSVEDQPLRASPRPATALHELAGVIFKLQKQRRAVRVRDLARGDVIEFRVELAAEASYEISAAITSVLDLLKDHAAMFGVAAVDLAQGEVLSELLRRMLVDLVPITARVTSHRLVVIDGEPWVVDAKAIAHAGPLNDNAEELTIAGVTELPSFWKDVRRILFDGSAYTAYVRLSKPGLCDEWSPVKLADVFERVFPDVGAHLRELPKLLAGGPSTPAVAATPSAAAVLREHGLVPFGIQLAMLAQRPVDEAVLDEVAVSAAQRVATGDDLADVGIVRSAFADVIQLVEDGSPIDRELVRALRETHQEIARLRYAAATAVQDATPSQIEPANPMLEVEFIAIYW